METGGSWRNTPFPCILSLFQFAEDAALATGFDVIEPFAMVTHPTVGSRLHSF